MPSSGVRRPESVLVVVHTRELDCLLLERVKPRGFWQSVTGGLEWDESSHDAAVRELREETGLGPDGLRDAEFSQTFPIHPEWRSRYAPECDSNLEHVWYLEIDRAAGIQLNPMEHVNYDWLALPAAIARVNSWTNRDALERLARQSRGA